MAKIVCVSNAYQHKYYLDPDFAGMPKQVRDELKVMCVLFTEDAGGILVMEFDDENQDLLLHSMHNDDDMFYDEIGSEIKIGEIQREKQDLLTSIDRYYKEVVLKK